MENIGVLNLYGRVNDKAAKLMKPLRVPARELPSHPGQLAALAVRIYKLFAEMTAKTHDHACAMPDAATAHAIMTALRAPKTPSKPSIATLAENTRSVAAGLATLAARRACELQAENCAAQ